jgi:hypothetical protein
VAIPAFALVVFLDSHPALTGPEPPCSSGESEQRIEDGSAFATRPTERGRGETVSYRTCAFSSRTGCGRASWRGAVHCGASDLTVSVDLLTDCRHWLGARCTS